MEDGEVAILESASSRISAARYSMTAARYTGAPAPTVMSKNTRGQAIFVRLRGFKMISFQSGGAA